jgi:hypothetical protein
MARNVKNVCVKNWIDRFQHAAPPSNLMDIFLATDLFASRRRCRTLDGMIKQEQERAQIAGDQAADEKDSCGGKCQGGSLAF